VIDLAGAEVGGRESDEQVARVVATDAAGSPEAERYAPGNAFELMR